MAINFLAILISTISSAYLFRGLWSGRFIGEIFDTRLMIVLHEHWFRFFSGKTSFLDAGFFYPYPRSFGLTDTFLLTGITHSVARIAGFDVIQSWIISQIVWVLIGLIGWYFLAKKLLTNRFLQLLTIPLIATSFTFVAHMNERPNVIPYLLVSWIFVALFNFYDSENKKLNSIYFGLSLVFIPLIVLTSWYAGFFIVIFILTLLLVSSILKAKYLKIILTKIRNIDLFYFAPFAVLSFALTSLWAYIYLPELENSAEVARPKSEVINGSPRFVDLFNTSALSGSRFPLLPTASYEIMEENKIGIGLLPILVFLFLIIFFWKYHANQISTHSKSLLISTIITGFLIELIIMKINNNSIFIFLFDNISFLKAIRTPVRWHIYFLFLILILILYLIDQLANKKNFYFNLLLLALPFLLLIEQQRTAPGLWQRDEFLDQNLISYQNKLSDCTAFVLDQPETGYWSDMIQALALSIYVNKPTANGYSGSVPKNYPSFDWYSDGNLTAMGDWLKKNDALSGVCLLDGFNFENISKFDGNSVQFMPGSGFTGLEKSKENSWAWSVWQQSSFFIHNFKSNQILGNLTFTIELPECLSGANFEIKGDNIFQRISITDAKSAQLQLPISLAAWERTKFTISTDAGFCQISDDPRELHFSIKNAQVQELSK